MYKRNYKGLKKDKNNIEKFQEEKVNVNPIFKYNKNIFYTYYN